MAEFALGVADLGTEIDLTGLKKGSEKAHSIAQSQFKEIGGSMGTALKVGIAAASAAAVAAVVTVGKAAFDVATEVKTATDNLIAGTAASGGALEDMRQRVINLKGETAGLGRDMGEIASVMAEVNTRTGATGEQLESLTGKMLNMTRITGDDGVGSVQKITRVMGDWGVELDDSEQLMDKLFGAGQVFGIGLDGLSSKLVQFGAPLRQMGFSLDESIALFGKWEKEGVNAELAIGSLRIAAGKFARDNVDLRDGLESTMEAIRGASSESEALAIAMEVFGARAGPDMAAAIREGRFELEEAIKAMDATGGAIDDVVERTTGLEQRWEMAMSQMRTSLVPLGDGLRGLALEAMPTIEIAVGNLNTFLSETVPSTIKRVREAWDGDWAGIRSTIADTREAIGMDLIAIRVKLALFWQDVRRLFTDEQGAVGGDWEDFWGGLLKYASATLRTIVDFLSLQLSLIHGLFNIVMGVVTLDWELAWTGIQRIATSTMQFILNTIENFFGPEIRRKFADALNGAWNELRAIWGRIKAWWDSTIGALLGVANAGPAGGGGGNGGFGGVPLPVPPMSSPSLGGSQFPIPPMGAVSVQQNFYGDANARTVRQATDDGIRAAMLRSGRR